MFWITSSYECVVDKLVVKKGNVKLANNVDARIWKPKFGIRHLDVDSSPLYSPPEQCKPACGEHIELMLL